MKQINFGLRLKFLKKAMGPGIITGAADDDPSGIATYSQTGAQYGLSFLWLSLFSFPLMAVTQEMCARIGIVTGMGLAANIKKNYSKFVLYFSIILLFLANTFNISADLRAMADSVRLLYPSANILLLAFLFSIFTILTQIFIPYKKYVDILKFFVLFLFCYIITVFFIQVEWSKVFYFTIIPHFAFNKDSILLVCAILGTTISPYLFFWQPSQEIEEEIISGKTTLQELKLTSSEDIFKMRINVWSGMFISNLIMFFIILVCGTVFFKNGITDIQTSADAALALKPLAGNFAYLLFSFGIIGTGLLAIPVLAGSSAYAISESFDKKLGLEKKFSEANFFYSVIIFSILIAFFINFINIDPIKALIYSAEGNSLVAPIILFLIWRISRNKNIMGEWANGFYTNLFAFLVTFIMFSVALATIYFLF